MQLMAHYEQHKFRDQFNLQSHWALRVNELQELFLRHKPDIVHFSGHGSDASEIVLENPEKASHLWCLHMRLEISSKSFVIKFAA